MINYSKFFLLLFFLVSACSSPDRSRVANGEECSSRVEIVVKVDLVRKNGYGYELMKENGVTPVFDMAYITIIHPESYKGLFLKIVMWDDDAESIFGSVGNIVSFCIQREFIDDNVGEPILSVFMHDMKLK